VADSLGDRTLYGRLAQWIWSGQVERVIEELHGHAQRLGPFASDACVAELPPGDPRRRVAEAATYYANHRHLMNYPEYRKAGLPLTSSHIESTVKQIAARVKGSEKFWTQACGEAVLQLRADCLSDSRTWDRFWTHWHARQNGTNRYRTA
jgi:hypothetical protein